VGVDPPNPIIISPLLMIGTVQWPLIRLVQQLTVRNATVKSVCQIIQYDVMNIVC